MPRDADGDPPSRTTPDGLLPRAALAGLVAVATAMAVTGCSVFGLDDLGSAAVDQAAQATGSDVGLGAPEDSDLDSSGTEDDEQVQRGADEDRSTDQPGAGATAGAAVLVAGPNGGAGPGPGALVGRLVDAVSGLPIRDTGVSLLAQERRTISGPDGSFRLDGVA
ncbi:MAG: hypothetical protein ACK2UL_10690, partial [Anaerolineae bacterium]